MKSKRRKQRNKAVKKSSSRRGYLASLASFDAAVCEAVAVSQAQAGRIERPNVAWGSYIYARMCSHATLMIRAAPLSRWVQSDHDNWDFSSVSAHTRALLEGYLFLAYMLEDPSSDEEMGARVDLLHLNDCTRRLELMLNLGDKAQATKFARQQQELRDRLQSNPYFAALDAKVQKTCLSGNKPWLKDREQLLGSIDMSKAHFDAWWNHFSQHAHILPLSFHRMEPNGRGSGIENETDRDYIKSALDLGGQLLKGATDRVVELFPDVAAHRRGVASVFSPGPAANAPAEPTRGEVDFEALQKAIRSALDPH